MQSKSMYVWHDDGMSAPRKRDFENDITSFKDLPRCCSLPCHAPLAAPHHAALHCGMWRSPLCQLLSEGNGLHAVQRGEATGGPDDYTRGFTSFSLKGGAGKGV